MWEIVAIVTAVVLLAGAAIYSLYEYVDPDKNDDQPYSF